MTSALAAFAQQQEEEARRADASARVNAGADADIPDEEDGDFAATGDGEDSQRKVAVTLLDEARAQQPHDHGDAPTTLMQVAQTHEREAAVQKLAALAQELNQEQHAAENQRAVELQRVLEDTTAQVKAEKESIRRAEVAQALQEAAQEEEAYEEEQFEQEEAAVQSAADRLAQATRQTASRDVRPETTRSVDRHILKQRQSAHGLQSRSTTKIPTMKDALSVYQFGQLTTTQSRLFLAMVVDDKRHEPVKKRCSMRAIDELAKSKASRERRARRTGSGEQRAIEYAKLDDMRHCRFKPRFRRDPNATARAGSDDEGDNQKTEDFIRRMEATERVRVEQVRRTRAEREYNALVNKKECPACGNPQSYAELSQKRKKCPNCGIAYKNRITWSEIADEFLERMAAHAESQQRRRQEPQPQPQIDQHTTTNANKRGGHSADAPSWDAVRDAFLGRVQLDLQQREMTRELILQEIERECTFTPAISARAQRLQLADFDERLRRDLEHRRARQEQYQQLSVAIARGERETSSRPVSKRGAKTKPQQRGGGDGFQARLREDLAKRRERMAQALQHESQPKKTHPATHPRVVAWSSGRH